MAQDKKTIDFRDVPDLLHVNVDLEGNDIPDGVSTERFDRLSEAVINVITASIRDIHGLPQDNEQLLCDGCVANVLQNALLMVMQNAHMSTASAAKLLRSISKDYFKMSLELGGASGGLAEILGEISQLGGVNVEVIDLNDLDKTVN